MKFKIIFILLLGVILVHYTWTTTYCKWTFDLNANHGGYYNLLKDSLLKGHLYLPIDPRPELLALPDPYDPASNGPYRLHDASLYNGKYYLYFGITPVITLFLPYFLLTNHNMPYNLAVLLFSFGGFIFAVGILFSIIRRYFAAAPRWIFLLSVTVLGFANFAPYNLRRPDMYEVAISCGLFFLTGAMYFFCSALKNDNPSMLMLTLGSLFLGLAVGGRPQIVLSGVILVGLLLKVLKSNSDKKYLWRFFTCLFVPFGICMLLLGAYNFLRFGNPFDFGHSYQLPALHIKTIQLFKLESILPGIYFNLIEFPLVNSVFPFVYSYSKLPPSIQPTIPYYFERTVGALSVVPFILLILLGPFFYWLQMFLNCKTKCVKNKALLYSLYGTIAFFVVLYVSTFMLQIFQGIRFIDELRGFFNKLIEVVPFYVIFAFVFLVSIFLWLYKSKSSCSESCRNSNKFPLTEVLIIFVPGMLNLFSLALIPMSTMRYLQDFVTPFILAASILWVYFDQLLIKKSLFRILLTSLASIFALVSISTGLAFSIMGCYEGLKAMNPHEFSELTFKFRWVAEMIHFLAPLWGQS